MAKELTGIIGWLFIPKLAVSIVLRIAHGILRIIAPHRVPHPNTTAYRLHSRIAYVFVIAVYLLYTMWEVERGLGLNFYQKLGTLPHPAQFSEHTMKRTYRALTLRLHPDKNPGYQAQFIELQAAYQTLSDPITRFAYERGGVDAIRCAWCKSSSDYLFSAIKLRIPLYIGYVLVNAAIHAFKVAQNGIYWRYLAIAVFIFADLSTLTSIKAPALIRVFQWTVAPHRTSFELLKVFQQALVCFFISLNHIAPQFVPAEQAVSAATLASALHDSIGATYAETKGLVFRLVSSFARTGLNRTLASSFENELVLCKTLGSSSEFQKRYTAALRDAYAAGD